MIQFQVRSATEVEQKKFPLTWDILELEQRHMDISGRRAHHKMVDQPSKALRFPSKPSFECQVADLTVLYSIAEV